MPHLSKKKVKRKVYLKIQEEFISFLSNKRNFDETKRIYESIFTYTERLMLSKRLSIIVMLEVGRSSYVIEKTLKVSPSTVARILQNKENGLYNGILMAYTKREEASFWKNVEQILSFGLPPIAGRGRWKKSYLNHDD